jgi:hypothetical protein
MLTFWNRLQVKLCQFLENGSSSPKNLVDSSFGSCWASYLALSSLQWPGKCGLWKFRIMKRHQLCGSTCAYLLKVSISQFPRGCTLCDIYFLRFRRLELKGRKESPSTCFGPRQHPASHAWWWKGTPWGQGPQTMLKTGSQHCGRKYRVTNHT